MRELFLGGLDPGAPRVELRAAVIDALGGADIVERLHLFDDGRDYGFATLREGASADAALEAGPRGPYARIEAARSTRSSSSQRRTLRCGLLPASPLDAGSAAAPPLDDDGDDDGDGSLASFGQFVRPEVVGEREVTIIGDGVKSPENTGAMLRLMATLGSSSLFHVHADASPPPRWDGDGPADVALGAKCHSVSVGCHEHVDRTCCARSTLVEYLRSSDRLPVVAVETASDAIDLTEYAFPRRCAIMVGGEGCGIHKSVADALRPDMGDSFVIIPMAGPHNSLNVATSLAIALYEYRRQWPAAARR